VVGEGERGEDGDQPLGSGGAIGEKASDVRGGGLVLVPEAEAVGGDEEDHRLRELGERSRGYGRGGEGRGADEEERGCRSEGGGEEEQKAGGCVGPGCVSGGGGIVGEEGGGGQRRVSEERRRHGRCLLVGNSLRIWCGSGCNWESRSCLQSGGGPCDWRRGHICIFVFNKYIFEI
jgi:hypothetical protein